MTETRRPARERSYVPTVLLGLAGAVLTAVAGARGWATTRGDAAGIKVEATVSGSESQPLVTALSLVALAAWGVVLVMRGRLRRAVAVVGLAASAGAAASVVLGFSQAQADSLEAATSQGAGGDTYLTTLTPWYYLAAVGAVLATFGFAVAVLRAPRWPAMGAKYDAPSARAEQPADEDLWRALDEGRDPTA